MICTLYWCSCFKRFAKVEIAKLVLITRLQHALGVMLLKYMVRRDEVCIKEGASRRRRYSVTQCSLHARRLLRERRVTRDWIDREDTNSFFDKEEGRCVSRRNTYRNPGSTISPDGTWPLQGGVGSQVQVVSCMRVEYLRAYASRVNG